MPEADPSGGKGGGGNHFEPVSGQERQYGELQHRLRRSMNEHGQPCCTAEQDDQASGSSAEGARDESAVCTPDKERDERSRQRIGEQIAAGKCGRAKKMSQSSRGKRGGRKDRQSQRAFNEIGAQGSCR